MDLSEAGARSPTHRHPWEIARLWVLRRFVRDQVPIAPGDAIVDIGCGDAFVIGELARAFPGASFFGVDSALSADAITERRRDLPANVHLFRELDDVPLTRPAALVLLMDVIEHVEDDRGFLRSLLARPMIGDRTRVFVTVPAYQALFSSHDVFLRHFRRYSNRQLRDALESSGLGVIDAGYFFSSLLPVRVMQVIRERLARPAGTAGGTGLTEYSGGALVTALVSRVLIVDALAALALKKVGVRVPGLSNYAVCRTSA